MGTTIRSDLGTTRLDRRDVLRRSAVGLALPAALGATAAARTGAAGGASRTAQTDEGGRTVGSGGFSAAGLERMHDTLARHVEQ